MAITKTQKTVDFNSLHRGQPFAATKTLYTRSFEEKEYMFFKLARNKAITVDKKTVILMDADDTIIPCVMGESTKH